MLGSKRDDSRHPTAIVRDVVEVVAIVLAGVWAIYTFVYAERIKPASEPPQINLTGSLVRQGEHNGLVAFAYNVLVHNTGSRDVHIVATGFSANGERYASTVQPYAHTEPDNHLTEYDADARLASSKSVYRLVEYTFNESKTFRNGYELTPGTDVPYSGVFFVKRAAYDEITFFASVAYSKEDRVLPVKTQNIGGTIQFQSVTKDPALATFQVTLARASLW